jgi:hypothetical protein
VRLSYAATLLLVAGGIWSGLNATSIDAIWSWLIIGLYSSVLLPNLLRWYWWRLNGWGYSIGVLASLGLALVLLAVNAARKDNPIPEYVYAPVLNAVALAGCVLGSLATRPVDEPTIQNFFRRVRPLGWWGPVRRRSGLSPEVLYKGQDHPGRIVVNVLLGMAALLSSYLCPLYLIGHWFAWAWLNLVVFVTCCVVLYFTWWRWLEREERDADVAQKSYDGTLVAS